MPDLSQYVVDLDSPQPGNRRGESPRTAFNKHNDLVERLQNFVELGADGRVSSGLITQRDHGQCRFVYVSDTQCALLPFDGNGLIVNDKQCRIPPGGALLTNAATSANATYYVFGRDNGAGIVTLDAIGTGTVSRGTHTNGVEICAGDPSRTLVGMVQTDANNRFLWSQTARGVASWFNRRAVALREYGNATTAATCYARLTNGFNTLSWGDRMVELMLSGVAAPQGGSTGGYLLITVNGTSIGGGYGYTLGTAGAQSPTAVNALYTASADGYFNFAPYGATGSAAVPIAFTQELNGVVWI